MPELLRAWGEALGPKGENGQVAVLIALAVLAALLALFGIGALARALARGIDAPTRTSRDPHL